MPTSDIDASRALFKMPITDAASAESYLKLLATGDFSYHIDDSPFDVFGFSEADAAALSKQMDLVMTYLTNEQAWEIYGTAVGV